MVVCCLPEFVYYATESVEIDRLKHDPTVYFPKKNFSRYQRHVDERVPHMHATDRG